MVKEFFRVDDIAEALSVSRGLVYLWIRKEIVRHVHIGKQIRILTSELERLMTSGLAASPEPNGTP